MSDSVRITVTADGSQATRTFRDVNGQLRDMRGRFAAEGGAMSSAMNRVSSSIGGVKGALIPLATAAVPLLAKTATATGAVAIKAAGAGVALGAFGAAVAGQISSLKEAGEAQKKYTDAVTQHGRGSKQAAEAQRAVQTELASMPQATARASVALGTLKGTFQDFSDSTAKFTMKPVEKSFTLLGQVVPKLTPMVKGASTELDRLINVAGGAIATPGFDALTEKVSAFATRSLREAVDGIIHFSRALSEGEASGPVQAFMDYAAKNGPAVEDTLANVGDAVVTLAQGAAEAGPGMLTLVNAAAGLVASFPPELVTVLLQTSVALKAVSLAGAAAAGIGGIMTAARTQIASLGATAAAAGGGLAGLRAAFLSLGTAAKASVVAAGVIAVGLAVSKLSDIGQQAPAKMDQLTSSIRELGKTGKVTGEAARVFGTDMTELAASFDKVSDNGVVEFFDELSTGFGLFGEGTNEAAKNMIDDFDESLSSLVKSGNADLAKASLENFRKIAAASGYDLGDVEKRLDGYKSALKDAKFEQDQAAAGMGFFGQAAMQTSAKLDAQKMAADGLRASILALNDVNRSAHDAQTNFERSLDGLTESFKEHGNTLNKDTAAGQANRDAMSAAAKAHDEMLVAQVAAGASMKSMVKDSEGLRAEMMLQATAALGSKKAAKEYVDQLLGTPESITTTIKAEKDQAIAGLESVRAAIQATPGKKEVKVDTLNAAAIAALEAVGLKTKQLPDGKTAVFTANGQALGSIGAVSTALNNLNGKTARTFTTHTIRTINEIITKSKTYRSVHDIVGATGGLFTGRSFKRGYADGGLVEGPGTGTSDDVFAPWLSNGEFVMRAAAVQKYGEKFMQMLNAGAIDMPKMAKGGSIGRSARSAARGARDEIREATSGTTERSLLRLMDTISRGHIKMASALKQTTAALDKAKDKLGDLKSAASQLSSSVKGGVLSASNITRAAGKEDAPVTINTLMSQMIGSRDKATAFADALKRLRKRGLSKTLLRQIAEAGIEGGGLETAGAILGGGSSEIKSLNRLQSQISGAAGAAGKTTADYLYGPQIKSQEKLVKSLDRLSDALKAKKKAAGGIGGGLTVVGEEGPELVRLPHGSTVYPAGQSKHMAWQSMLNQPAPHAGRSARPMGGGSQAPVPHVVLEIKSGGSAMDSLLVEILRKAVRTRGGDAQVVLGTGRYRSADGRPIHRG
ncbi:phage tail protein [Streptomyces ossamyceticus]|uniref:phage tail protein n=1 Tax=Streptomyces ossamyceticus TaxID=249581 RepID=UPI00344A06FC